jgi:hypothetical protein
MMACARGRSQIVSDLSSMTEDQFWEEMVRNKWCYLYKNGRC